MYELPEAERVMRCPSTHCNRSGECRGPSDCFIHPRDEFGLPRDRRTGSVVRLAVRTTLAAD
jgi:hypothetical protein